MIARKRTRAAVLPVLMVGVLQACSDGRSTGPTSLAVAADGALQQSAVAGATVAAAVVVTDAAGRPQRGAQVSFEVTAGGGSVAAAPVAADAAGRASASWTLGTVAGANALVARVRDSSVTLKIVATAGAPTAVQIVSAAAELSGTSAVVSGPPAVRVTDIHGNGVPGVRVEFSAEGGGSVASPSVDTDAAGVAAPGEWRTGPAEGDQHLTARVEGLPPVSFRTRAVATASGGLTMTRLGGDQTTCPTGTTGCGFSVRVMRADAPVHGEAVQWTGIEGTTAVTSTNEHGLALATNLGRNGQRGTFTQTARLVSTGEQLVFTYSLVQPGGFTIDLRFLTGVSGAVATAFQQAKARWEHVITGNLPEATIGAGVVVANACGITHPAIQETVDDLLILVEVVPIDGAGKILGSAGPCLVRSLSGLPILGVMRLDSEDLEMMHSNGSLRDVILHEIGHVLGIGTLWTRHGLLEGAGSNDPFYSGARARPGFILGGSTILNGIPVENTGGGGTRDSHWREATMRTELMTGWINSGFNPLSGITIGSLMDMGYQVNFGAADPYVVPSGTLGGFGLSAPQHQLIEQPLPAPRTLP
jgi:hypothetical protein